MNPPDPYQNISGTPTVTVNENKKNYFDIKHILSFLIPVILLIFTIMLASYFGRQYFSRSGINATPTPESTPTLEPAATPTPNPKSVESRVYKNFDAGASFEYSPDLQVGLCADGVKLFEDLPVGYDPTGACANEPTGVISATFLSVPFAGIDSEAEVESVDDERIVISGVDALRQTVGGKSYVFFEKGGIYFRLILNDVSYKKEFDNLIKSFTFIDDPTKDWLTYSSPVGGFDIKYPESFSINTRSASFVDFTLDENTSLSIESAGSVSQASITAQQAASSIRNLSGWQGFPTVELEGIGGGTAQIISGNFEGHYQQYIILWYQDRVLQIGWSDSLDESNSDILDNMLNSLVFVN